MLNYAPWIAIPVMVVSVCVHAADWPMLGRDAQRSGWSPDEIRAPTKRKWYRSFHREGLACGVQPVIADGLVYLGTMHGTMHAMDAGTGRDVWTRRVGGGVMHSAAIADGQVYLGATDGVIYALDAKTGEVEWTVKTGKAISNAPVVAEGKVFVGSRDGSFYAVDAEGGQVAWQTTVGAPILCSPAYAEGRVLFAAENMRAYCLDAGNGRIQWQGQLHGVSARGYHPVIAGDKVFFVTQPGLGKFGPVDVLLDACRELGLQPRRRIGADPRGARETAEQIKAKDTNNRPLLHDLTIYPKQLEGVRRIQQQKPGTRTFFAFDVETGEEPYVVPLCWQESCGGTGNPAIVAPDGRVFLKYALFTWSKHGEYFPYTRLGQLDTETGNISLLHDPIEYAYPIGITHDEMARFTGSGNTIIHAREGFPGMRGVVGLDLETLKLQTLADNIHFGDSAIGPMNVLRLIKDQPIPAGFEYIPRGAGVFGGTGTYAAVSIADDTLYYIPGHEGRTSSMLIAWSTNPGGEAHEWQNPTDKKWHDTRFLEPENVALLRSQPFDWDMLLRPYGRCWPRPGDEQITPEPELAFQQRQQQAHQYAQSLSRDELAQYIWREEAARSIDEAPQALREELATKVSELIGQTWEPMRYPDLMFGGWYDFDDPTEVFETLALAWPALGDDLRAEVRTYLRQQFAQANPLTTEHLPLAGERRTAYELPDYAELSRRDLRPIGLGRLPALLAWCETTDDWDQLRPFWQGTIRPMVDDAAELDVADSLWANQQISGMIAYARLARAFGDDDAEREAETLAIEWLRKRIEAERTYNQTRFVRREGHPRTPAFPGRYLHLTPALARAIHDHALWPAQQLHQRYIAELRPMWYMAWGPMQYYAWETSVDHPINPWATFAARAMIFQDSGPALQAKLDLPWCKADLYYIQKLAWTIRADWP